MDLILHIGTAKTGTTSLQEFLAANRDSLRRKGILYPLSAGDGKSHALLSLIPPQVNLTSSHVYTLQAARTIKDLKLFREELKDALTKELNGRSNGTIQKAIMSSEYCSSRYSTRVKAGGTDRLEIPSPHNAVASFDHWELLSRWARVFGRAQIVCRKFEKDSLKSGDIIDDFLDLAGIGKAQRFQRPERMNVSLDGGCVEFLRIFNKYSPQPTPDPARRKRRLIGMLSEISTGPRVAMDEEKLDGFMKTFRESNKKVALEYFDGATRNDSDDFLFGPREGAGEPADESGLTVDRAIEISAYLWNANRTRVEGLLQQLNRKQRDAK
ncbi:MAG: hypothetical protein ABSA49_03450 [Rhizomicrobium sp.]